jgi:hypothetical protein
MQSSNSRGFIKAQDFSKQVILLKYVMIYQSIWSFITETEKFYTHI